LQASKKKIKMKLYQYISIIIILIFVLIPNIEAQEVYNWSNSEISLYQSDDFSSQVIGKIEVGEKVEILKFEGEETKVVEYWVLNSKDGKDTIEIIGKLIKIRGEKLEGFCLDTYFSKIEYDKNLLQNDSVYFAFDYYKRIMGLTKIEKDETISDEGDGTIEIGEIGYSNNSIMNYEYSGYGGGYSIQIDGMNWKDFLLLSLNLLEIHPRESYNVRTIKKGIIIGLDECESLFFRELQIGKIEIGYSAGC
jgi:hypothetical protein